MNSALSLSAMKKLLLIYQKIYIGGKRRKQTPNILAQGQLKASGKNCRGSPCKAAQHARRSHKVSELQAFQQGPLCA